MESTVWQTAVKGLVAMEAAPDTMIAMCSSGSYRSEARHVGLELHPMAENIL